MEQAAELRRGLTELAEQVGASVSWQMGTSNRWDAGTFDEKLAAIERNFQHTRTYRRYLAKS